MLSLPQWVFRAAAKLVTPIFHYAYYNLRSQTWQNTRWLGADCYKCPLDLWIYQEIFYEVRPTVIIECGVWRGGSTLYFASLCDLLGGGRVIGIDLVEMAGRPQHSRIRYIKGSSTDAATLSEVRASIGDDDRVLVILDSDHAKAHVLEELRAYSDLVTAGSYLIVEDTNVNGHPVFPGHGPGPMEAVEEFLRLDRRFQSDESRHKFLLSFNPRGYLKRL
jgi:cephalosporin hydroxylase